VIINFTVYGNPQGKARPRFGRHGQYVTTYTPHETVVYENMIKMSYVQQCGKYKFPESSALSMTITAFMPIPKSTLKRDLQFKQSEIEPHSKKPDISNIVKSIEDALIGFAYKDDAQIAFLTAKKVYSSLPRVEVSIRNISEKEV